MKIWFTIYSYYIKSYFAFMDINEKILNIITILYELEDSDNTKISDLLKKMSLKLKEKVLLSLYEAFEKHDFNINVLSTKTNLILNELEELKEKKELENFKI